MNGQGQLRGTLNIRERPAEADDRAVPGHWEGDLLMGKRMHAMATLVERKTRFVMLVALPNGHAADVVADALAAKIVELPEQLRRSITWDQGKEMAAHAQFTRRRPVCRSTSATRAAPGSAAATRTPTVCCVSTSRNAPRSRTSPKPTSTTSPQNSTTGLDKPSAGSHHHKHSTKCCVEPLNSQPLCARRRAWIRAPNTAAPDLRQPAGSDCRCARRRPLTCRKGAVASTPRRRDPHRRQQAVRRRDGSAS